MILRLRLNIISEEDRPLVGLRNLSTSQTQPGFGHVHKTHQTVDRHPGLLSWPPLFPLLRDPDNQRTMRSTGIQKTFAAWHGPAVIRVVNDNGVFIQSVSLERVNHLLDPIIHSLHSIGILRIVPTHVRQIRMVRGQRHVLRLVLRIPTPMHLTFVTKLHVDDCKEGFSFRTLLPSVSHPPIMPMIPGFIIRFHPADVVIGFPGIGRKVPGLLQHQRIRNHLTKRNLVPATHGLRTI